MCTGVARSTTRKLRTHRDSFFACEMGTAEDPELRVTLGAMKKVWQRGAVLLAALGLGCGGDSSPAAGTGSDASVSESGSPVDAASVDGSNPGADSPPRSRRRPA